MVVPRRSGRVVTRGNARANAAVAGRALRGGRLRQFLPEQTVGRSHGRLLDRIVRAAADGRAPRHLRKTLSVGEAGRSAIFSRTPDPGAARFRFRIAARAGTLPHPRTTGTSGGGAEIQMRIAL